MPSPQAVMMQARGSVIERGRTGLHADGTPVAKSNKLMLLQEGALNTAPRPRFKINDGRDEQVESIISQSHFDQSEINREETEGDLALSDHGTVTVGLGRV